MKQRFLVSLAGTVTACGLAVAVARSATVLGAPTTSPTATPAAAQHAPPKLTRQESDFFESRIRPIFASNCYKCHSIEERKAKGELLLDSREGWQKGGENGPAIVPGDPAKSLLLKAVSYADPDLQMPPNGNKLSDKQIADLTEWVKMGAPDPRNAPVAGGSKLTGLNDQARAHWAYQPIRNPAMPQVSNPAWVKTPVDAFVLAKLDQNGIKPSPPAPREALIRRATYDLIGLPPTPEEVRAFVKDRSPDAYEKLIDRLLASPHYGERWGRFWLDTARYSDTTGVDQVRRDDYRYAHAWTYRDYVIKAFNDDKPYDQFLMEQIAADHLPETKADPSRLAALGFITVGKRFQNPNDTLDERIDTLTKATMAMTVSCARCHDHKFDPIPTADYYSLHGIFASTTEPAEKPLIGQPPSGEAYEDFKKQLARLQEKNKEIYFNLVAQKSAEFRRKAPAYLLVAMTGRGRNQSPQAIKERNKLIAQNRLDRDLYQGGGLRGGRGVAESALLPLMRFAAIPKDQFEQQAKDVLAEVLRAGERAPEGRDARREVRGRDERRREMMRGDLRRGGRPGDRRQRVNPLVLQAFKQVDPESLRSMRDVADIYGKLFAKFEPKIRQYIEACRTAEGDTVEEFDPALVELASIPAPIQPAGTLTTEELRALAPRLPVVNNNAYQRFVFAKINELEMTHPGSPARAMAVVDASNPRNSPVFIRGEPRSRGPVVPRQFLEILAGKDRQPFTIGSGRLELAKAIATKSNPLTARVMINRVWMHHFGEGFVRTVDDLGVQSEPPSHPELLDYLSYRFADDGWSLKKMHRLIMLSSTYQQSSETNPAYAVKDPDNRLLWRANLRRLDFEAIRDSMLLYTGKLDRTIGGKPVNLTDEPYSNRRSVYGYIDRGNLPELMSQFDFADPDMANSKRTSTIVPQQALFFMNSPMSVDVARKVTSRPEFTSAKDDPGRVKALYEVLFQRAPRSDEVRFAMQFVRASQAADAKAEDAGSPDREKKGAKSDRDKRRAEKRPNRPPGMMRRNAGRGAIRNEGEIVERKPLTVWEQYAQALLFTNEIAYVN